MAHVRLLNSALKQVLRSNLNSHRQVIAPAIATRSLPCVKAYLGHFDQPRAWISTSKKQADESVPAEIVTESKKPEAKKNWVSYDFSHNSPEEDATIRNHLMFMGITIFVVLNSFILAYYPDAHMRDWSQREAYIELARREALGLPLIDPDLVPPEKINLPTDEELGDFEIII